MLSGRNSKSQLFIAECSKDLLNLEIATRWVGFLITPLHAFPICGKENIVQSLEIGSTNPLFFFCFLIFSIMNTKAVLRDTLRKFLVFLATSFCQFTFTVAIRDLLEILVFFYMPDIYYLCNFFLSRFQQTRTRCDYYIYFLLPKCGGDLQEFVLCSILFFSSLISLFLFPICFIVFS